jgi:TPR repeat protein
MSAREALFIALGFSSALLVALVVSLVTLGSSNRELQDRLIALQRATDDGRVKQLQAQVEQTGKREAELKQALDRAVGALRDLERIRAAEAEARRLGDLARQRELAEQARQREAEAANRAEAAKQADQAMLSTERAAIEKSRIASASPAASVPPPSGDQLFEQAAALEREGRFAEAVRAYTRAARSGNGKAAKRLGEIYDQGLPDVSRNYAESLKWTNTARALGEDVLSDKR